MKEEHLKYLVCPLCKGPLLISEVQNYHDRTIETGSLRCDQCAAKYDVTASIPRFVSNDNYASSFGFEWTKHARTQYDSYTGSKISETRFFESTRWPRKLEGELILEVGSGSGRFTEQAAATGAMVVSLDHGYACCRSNYASNGHKSNVLIVQGDLYRMPLRESFFDKLFCFGVLQHTPDVEKAFLTLLRHLKPGGSLTIDIYKRIEGIKNPLVTKYWVRPLTRKLKPEILYRLCKNYVEFMWPFAKLVNRIPRYGRALNWMMLIADYRGRYALPDELLKEWVILDTFDMLSPTYDYPQTLESVRKWFQEANLVNWEVCYGYNGIVGRGIRI